MLYFCIRMKNLVVFASGNGSNAENLFHSFKDHPSINIDHVITNKENAGVLERAKKWNKQTVYFSNEVFKSQPNLILQHLQSHNIDGIILAGFLLLFPKIIIDHYPDKVINVHPALLPKYGGKGMYGMHVHKVVIANRESESGITVHFVNEKYDEGSIVLQAKCKVDTEDSPEDLASKIRLLEFEYLPQAVLKVFA
jgi:phosphoribosylglycinamide formyltransferase 1